MPGCSTGEEAYSLAILCDEYLRENNDRRHEVQIFATDIDMGAIEIARAGTYPESITEDVSAARLNRYFVKKSGTYKIRDEVRESVVFAGQDLIKDPPFSRLDLISCRNVLIYMGAALQKKVLSFFHYALNPGGRPVPGLFGDRGGLRGQVLRHRTSGGRSTAPGASKCCRSPPSISAPRPPARRERDGGRCRESMGPAPFREHRGRHRKDSFSSVIPLPAVVVNDKGDILYFHGKTGKYLEPASGKAALNVLEMAREGLRIEIRTGLRKAVDQKERRGLRRAPGQTNGAHRSVNLEVRYVKQARAPGRARS